MCTGVLLQSMQLDLVSVQPWRSTCLQVKNDTSLRAGVAAENAIGCVITARCSDKFRLACSCVDSRGCPGDRLNES